jgi:hypothetical protein
MDIRFRVSSYPGGSRALELQDSEGQAFYVPTMPIDPLAMLDLVPPELADDIILGIKPSAIRNGIASCLVEAGLLVDLGIEMPVDRHFVHLMRFEPESADARAQAYEHKAASAVPAALQPVTVPTAWQPACRRIQAVFRRHGFIISEGDAFVAWLLSGGIVPRTPPRLPPSGDALFQMLRDRFDA